MLFGGSASSFLKGGLYAHHSALLLCSLPIRRYTQFIIEKINAVVLFVLIAEVF
jgi:hypothetical protein